MSQSFNTPDRPTYAAHAQAHHSNKKWSDFTRSRIEGIVGYPAVKLNFDDCDLQLMSDQNPTSECIDIDNLHVINSAAVKSAVYRHVR